MFKIWFWFLFPQKVCKVPENCQVLRAFVRVGKGPRQVNNESPPFLVALLE